MKPLEGLKVVEMGQLIAGPFCGQVLADFGAEVVKIEPPGTGDSMRQWGRSDESGRSVWWPVIARNKKSMTLNLRTTEGQEVVKRLAAEADIVIENFRVGTMEKWGLGYDTLSKINPRLIMVRITGFGQTGPYASRAGFASVCEAMGGLRYISGFPDRPPVRTGVSLGDSLAGLHGALGAMMAVEARHKTGKGQIVDASIYESVLNLMESLVSEYDKVGYIRERSGSVLPGIAPSNAYLAGDQKEVVIGANQDSVFQRLCKAMGNEAMGVDGRYSTHKARGENQVELDELISEWTRQHDASDIVMLLADAGVPAGLAYRAPDMMVDPHFMARESIVRVQDAGFGDIAMQNVFPRLSESPGGIEHTGPSLGENTQEILKSWLAFSESEIDDLANKNIV